MADMERDSLSVLLLLFLQHAILHMARGIVTGVRKYHEILLITFNLDSHGKHRRGCSTILHPERPTPRL